VAFFEIQILICISCIRTELLEDYIPSVMTETFNIQTSCCSNRADATLMIGITFSNDSRLIGVLGALLILWIGIVHTYINVMSLTLNTMNKPISVYSTIVALTILEIVVLFLYITATIFSLILCCQQNILSSTLSFEQIQKLKRFALIRRIALAFFICATFIEDFIVGFVLVYYVNNSKEQQAWVKGVMKFISYVLVLLKMIGGAIILSLTIPNYLNSKEVDLAIEYLSRESEHAYSMIEKPGF